ncbi:hypothetical protein AAKU52_002618 [Pedobacter sp. CG_S7]|uniref:DUF4099 domain-containing protein n=1 Tax=Pedobacter sp. CG_S7 TaxID=3143930 RepID=UPI00339713E3
MATQKEIQETEKNRLDKAVNSRPQNGDQTFSGLSEEEQSFEKSKGEAWEPVLPTQGDELDSYVANDGFLSNEELTRAIEDEYIERQQMLENLKTSTGENIDNEYPFYETVNPIEQIMTSKPEIEGVTSIDPNDLSKLTLDPSYLFAKDESGNIKVVSQEQDSNKMTLKDTKQEVSLMGAIPNIFTNKDVLEAFMENFSNAKQATDYMINTSGNKLSELVRGKVDLIMVTSKDGYEASLDKAKGMFNTQETNQENKVGAQASNKEDIKMENQLKTKFKESDVNWQQLEKIGVTKERLEITGQLTKYLNGERTNLIDPASLKAGHKYFLENTPFALQLKDGPNGPSNHMLFKESKLNIPDLYQGQQLSVADKTNLITKNHLGKLVDINGKPHFVSIDKELNQLSHREADSIKIPSKIKLANGAEILLTKDQQKILSEGKPAMIANLQDNKGQPYTGHLIVNAASGKLDVMKEVAPSMTQTIAHNQDKEQVLKNNEGARVKQTPKGNKLGL